MNLLFRFMFLFIFSTIANANHSIFTNEELNYINNNKVKIAMLPYFEPFSYYENNELKGYSVDMLDLISEKSGLRIEYVVDTWPNNLSKFKNKKVDMIDSISFKESRLSFTSFTSPYYEIPILTFIRKDSKIDGTKESMENKKLGITLNAYYKDDIKKLNHFEIIEYESFPKKVEALAIGEVDLIFGYMHSVQKLLKKENYTNIKVVNNNFINNLKTSDLRFGINKDNKILHSIITKSISTFKPVEFDNLYKKWINISNDGNTIDTHKVTLDKTEIDFIKNNTVRCATTTTWEPFNFKKNDHLVGIAVDYWNLIKKHSGLKSNCQEYDNYSMILDNIKNKKSDVTLSTTITKEKLKFANFSKTFASYQISIATTKDKSYISNTSYLNNKKVAIGQGYSVHTILKEKYPNINFILTKNTQESLKLVAEGKAFAAIDILPVLSHYISKFGYNNLKISGSTEFDFDMKIMIRKDYKELVSIINKSIDLISQEETNNILRRWTTVQIETNIDYTPAIYALLIVIIIFLFILYKQILLNKYNKKLEEKIEEEVKKSRLKDRQMLHQSRLAQMGEMISMIAHQWRQPLTSIAATILKLQMYVEFEKFDLKNKKERKKFLEELNKEFGNMEFFIHTLTSTIDDFRNFYKPNKELELMYVSDVIKTSLDVIGVSLMNQKIDLIENYNCNKKIYLYKNELMQVILNIIKNSQDIFLERNIKNPFITINTIQLENDIKIEIKDNAMGIDKDILEKIFDPYFSTKTQKEGTGLGLYMSKIIIEDHHKGKLEVRNDEDGVVFSIYLPKKTSKEED